MLTGSFEFAPGSRVPAVAFGADWAAADRGTAASASTQAAIRAAGKIRPCGLMGKPGAMLVERRHRPA